MRCRAVILIQSNFVLNEGAIYALQQPKHEVSELARTDHFVCGILLTSELRQDSACTRTVA